MLYRIINETDRQNLAILGVANTVLQEQGIFITDGIAASRLTQIHLNSEGWKYFRHNRKLFSPDHGFHGIIDEELERKLMAECLVPNQVNPEHIQRFIVADHTVAAPLQARLSPSDLRKLVVATDVGNNIFTPSFD